jgi:hypothetical protein
MPQLLCRRCFYHWAFAVLPGTLWLAWVLSTWRRTGTYGTTTKALPPAAANGALLNGHSGARRHSGKTPEQRMWRGPRNWLGWPKLFTTLQVMKRAPFKCKNVLR